ncbi:MAG: SUMF1/EgtB/PvdO family nonheme iron enzyme [Planctomycetes bacterium]|nr:SUMF1/EgtB/PvdO family nonheme iron enzyme [Planctomycetota bacterium]
MSDEELGRGEASVDAESVFLGFVLEADAADEEAFAALCARHPGAAEPLRELRAGWLRVAGFLDDLSRAPEPEVGGDVTDELRTSLRRRLRSFSRYRLEGEIARGGQGTVVRVWEEDLRRHLAMKRLNPELTPGMGRAPTPHGTRSLHRFLEEAQITGQLGHPGVPPVHELGLDAEGRPFFTMPLVRGQELTKVFRALREGSAEWTLARTLGVFLKVCEAVAYAHAKGVLHRDLKPGNVMVGRFGETYVMDWGLASVAGRKHQPDLRLRDAEPESVSISTHRARDREDDSPLVTVDGDVLGTPAYMAPEQARGELSTLTERADVYSIGAMLYHMLAGHAPYLEPGQSTGGRAVLTRVLAGPPRPLRELASDAPPELVAVAEKAMSRDTAARYADAGELARDLLAYLDHRPVAAHAPGLWHTLKLSIRRHRAVATAVGVAAAVLVASTLLFVWRLSDVAAKERLARTTSDRRFLSIEGRSLLNAEPRIYPVSRRTVPNMRAWIDSVEQHLQTPMPAAEAASSLPLLERSALEEAGLVRNLLVEPLGRAKRMLSVAEALPEPRSAPMGSEWERALFELQRTAVYEGLTLEPCEDLVPLGINPQSGLLEFWHVPSGSRPKPRGDWTSNGEWLVAPDTGIVFVLLPGGRFMKGSLPEERGHYDNELVRDVGVRPFLLSKYELTQGQFLRVMGDNPSVWKPERDSCFTLAHPVENIDHLQASEVARRYSARLPSDAESEYASRAGTLTAYYWGDSELGARGFENLRDSRNWAVGAPNTRAPWGDPFRYHAPVGSFLPNPWGLFDMQGNVREWCCERAFDLSGPEPPWSEEDLQGAESMPATWTYLFRGGSFYLRPYYCRSAFRQEDVPNGSNMTAGVRLARDLQAGEQGLSDDVR